MKKFFKLVIVPIAIVCLSACFLLPTQDADRDNSTPTETTGEKGSVKFAFSGSNSISANVMANSVSSGISYSTASTGETPSRVSISYRKVGATSDATTSLELSAFGSSFVIADPISLDPGNYEVTKFDVLNSSGRTIYSTPMTGSVIDNFLDISTSLAYGFTVKAGENEPINMTVVGVNEDSKASDFGRDAFTYEVITYSEFYIAAYLQDEKYALTATPATLTIKNPSGTTITNKNLSAGENRILVADYDTYTFTVSKDSLATKSFTISKDSLAKHKSEALQVIFFSTPHAYKFINKNMTWSEAKAYCEGLGGYLVTITSQEENSYIAKNILVPNGAPGCWAGGSDRETEKTWKWVTGEAWTYNNWAVGEPNNWFNGTEDEDYLQIFGSNCEWNDGYETTLLPFICEWNSEADMLNACYNIAYDANGGSGSVPTVATTKLDEVTIASGSNLSKAGYTFIGWSTNSSATSITYTTGQKVKFTSSTTLYAVWKNNSLYKFINENMTWSQAKAYCEGLGGHLVTITSQEENSYIAKNILVPNGAPGCWAGGTDRETEDTWKWVTGEAWTYNNWAVGEPNNWGDEDYLQIFGSNCNWNDGYETTLLPFICEWDSEADIKTPTTADYTNSIGMEFVLVEAGTFMMGDGNDGFSWTSPVHQVTLTKDYYIGKYEVTQAQWVAVMGSNPSNFKGDNLPVEQVSWNMIQEFITKLNQMEGTDKYCLPTEAQWEFAARGGNKSQGYTYAGSNNLDEVAWYYNNSSSQTHEVGTKKANELGIYDMSGNVWEWCSDWYGSYSSEAVTDPSGPSTGSGRVVRGSSWSNDGDFCRVADRRIYNLSFYFYYIGFRILVHK